jgi:hypothetical protein
MLIACCNFELTVADEKTHVRRAILRSSTKMLKGKEHKDESD